MNDLSISIALDKLNEGFKCNHDNTYVIKRICPG